MGYNRGSKGQPELCARQVALAGSQFPTKRLRVQESRKSRGSRYSLHVVTSLPGWRRVDRERREVYGLRTARCLHHMSQRGGE